MKKRQKFFSETHYKNFLREHDEVIDFLKTNTFESDSLRKRQHFALGICKNSRLTGFLAAYTAGEEITSLPPLLSDLIDKYETRQAKLAIFENTPEITPLAIDDWPYLYEECVQVIGFCILLYRTDLLKRFVKLMDDAGYVGSDTLFEDLLIKLLPDRKDVDQWFHDIYTPLVQAIYAESKEEASSRLEQYCCQWYSAFEQAPWHDLHQQGENGNYVGYWAIEAGAIAFLYGIDDSKIDHMVYPKDLVEYARNLQPQ